MKRLCCRTIKCSIKWVSLIGFAVFILHWLGHSDRFNADCADDESKCTKRLFKTVGIYVGGVVVLCIVLLLIVLQGLVGEF